MGIGWRYCRLMLIPLGILAASGAGGGGSYESIASATGTGSAGNIVFNSIPSTYSALQIRAIARDTYNDGSSILLDLQMQFNGDTGSNYTKHLLTGNGSSASASGGASRTTMEIAALPSATATSSMMSGMVLDIQDYASTSKYKTVRSFSGMDGNAANTQYVVTLRSSLWMSTSAVTSITLIPATAFTTSTTFALYGIKGA